MLALVLSDVPVIILVLLVLANIPPEVLSILHIVGGVFLLYLAFNAFKAGRAFTPNLKEDNTPKFTILKAVLVNLPNPNPYITWSLVMGPLLIKGWSENPVNGIVLLTGFYGSMIIYSIGLIGLLAEARNF